MTKIDPKTLINIQEMSNQEFAILMSNIETLNADFLSTMPQSREERIRVRESSESDLFHVVDDVFLVRAAVLEEQGFVAEDRRCVECVMNPFQCTGIPCAAFSRADREGYTAIRAQVQPVAMPTNGKKKVKREYIPDTAANFDFSDQNWKSVRSMIGM